MAVDGVGIGSGERRETAYRTVSLLDKAYS